MSRYLFVLGFTFSFVAWADAPVASKKVQRYALLIAADDYAPPLAKLEYCHNDMTALAETLEAAGFAPDNITFMNDQADSSRLRPTRANIERELNLRLQLANKDDVVLVAFSGHGVHIDGASYLCPTDANLDGTNSLVSINDVYSHLENSSAGQKLLIIDACRNELVLRGFKSSQSFADAAIQLQSPPKGLVVLSSCEPKQYSAEDSSLKKGVFMHYIVDGLGGAADRNIAIGGNGDGRISLDELYYYAHEKTKIHVAKSHGIVQRPVMKGELVGRFDLADVPQDTDFRTIVRRPKKSSAIEPVAAKAVDSPILKQGDDYLKAGDYDNAISAYSAVVDDASADAAVKREARLGRGAAYMARARKDDLDKALIDQLAAGTAGMKLPVRAPVADLKIGHAVQGTVKLNQSLLVTKINGDWLWVASVDGSEAVQGYVQKSAVLEQPAVATTRSTGQVPTVTTYPEQWQRPQPTRPSGSPIIKEWLHHHHHHGHHHHDHHHHEHHEHGHHGGHHGHGHHHGGGHHSFGGFKFSF